jgi:hypothetical protein
MEHNPYAAPAAELATDALAASTQSMFYVVSTRKAALLCVLTMNLYFVYWFYRNWSNYRAVTGAKVMPVMRAVFSIFFTHSLLRKVNEVINERGLQHQWNPGNLATGYVVLAILGNMIDRMSFREVGSPITDVLSLLMVLGLAIVIVQMQRAVNIAAGDEDGSSNQQLTVANWIWMGLGGALWMLTLYGLFLIMIGA